MKHHPLPRNPQPTESLVQVTCSVIGAIAYAILLLVGLDWT